MSAARSPGLKRIFFDRIFHGSYWTWRKHPAIIVPTMLGTGLIAVTQSIITLAAILVLTDFAIRNQLFNFLVSLTNNGVFQALQNPAYSPTILLATIITVVAVTVALVLGGGFVQSAEYATYLEAWQTDKASFQSIVQNGSRTWKQMAWTLFVSNLITWAPLLIGLALVLLSLPSIQTSQGVAAFIGGIYIILFGLGASLVLAIFTLYSYPAVVVDRLSGLKAVRQSFQVASHNLGVTMTYGVIRIIFQMLSVLTVVFAGYVGLPLTSMATAILSLLLTPILHSTKTIIYYHAGPRVAEMPFAVEDPIWNDIYRKLPRAAWARVKLGLSECVRFFISPSNMPFHLLSVLAFAIGILWGDFVSNNGIKQFVLDDPNYQPGILNPFLANVIPPALGVEIFFNNWLVSIAAALSGIGFALPSFQVILFNGFILGAISPLVPTFTMLLAVIAPHGIIEIPAFLLAGSVGIKLGYAALKTRTQPGPKSSEYLSTVLRQTVYIVIGLAPLFLIAGLIEADLTPVIARMFGWT